MHTCSKCQATSLVAIGFLTPRKWKTKKGEVKEGFQNYCLTCSRLACSKWHKENREKANANKKAWKLANPDKVQAGRVKELAKRDLDRDTHKAYSRQHYSENKHYYAEKTNKRRKRMKAEQTPSWANLEAIKEFYLVAEAMTRATGVEYHVDHIDPLNPRNKLVCGLHAPANLRIVPATTNLKKRDRFKPYGFDGWYYDL